MEKRKLKSLQANLRQEADLIADLFDAVAQIDPDAVQVDLAPMKAMAKGAHELALQLVQLEARRIPVKIAIVGDFSAGKSSFINSLLQDNGLCPEHDHPTTSYVTTFAYGTVERIVRHHADGRDTKLSRGQYQQQVQNRKAGGRATDVQRFSFFTPIPLLKGLELLDTPGFNNPRNAADSEVTIGIMQEADAFLYLVDASAGTIAESGLERLRQIRKLTTDAPIYLIVSKADNKDPVALDRIKEAYRKKHSDLFSGRIYSYTTQPGSGRTDIDAGADIGKMFDEMRKLKFFVLAGALRRRMSQHQDQREQIEVRLRHQLQGMIVHQLGKVASGEKCAQIVSEKLDKLQVDMAAAYQREVHDALVGSFYVREIKGTGIIFNDAEIIYSPRPLSVAMASFRSTAAIRERLLAEIIKHFRDRKMEVSSDIEAACKAAIADTVSNAEKFLAQKFKPHIQKTYDFDTVAKDKLKGLLKAHGATLPESLWNDWLGWISGLYALLKEEYIEPSMQSGREHASRLEGILQFYCELTAAAKSLVN